MSAHWDSEHDMVSTVERRTRRPIARTTHGISAHQQNWRAANAQRFDDEDDALRAARGIWNGLLIGGALWAFLAVCVWGFSMLWTA